MPAVVSTMQSVLSVLILLSLASADKYEPIKVEIQTSINEKPPTIFTAEELAKYDASDPNLPIYLAIKGVVFDVTAGKGFYTKESDYNALTGKDASRAHASWSLDKKDLNHDLTGLTDDQLKGLDEIFKGTYMAKYPVVGYMDYLINQQSDDIKKKFTNDEL